MNHTLQKKYELYKKLARRHQDRDGFIESYMCDSTLFSGLIGCVLEVDLEAAQPSAGQWLRRPISRVECWSCGRSRSTISRDMLIGVLWWATANNRPDIIHNIWKYAWRHWWRMGKGRWGGVDTIMNPALMSTIALLLVNRFQVESFWLRLWSRLPYRPGKGEGYVRHIQTLLMLLRDTCQPPSEAEMDRRVANFIAEPRNPLYAYAAGDMTTCESLLLTSPLYPNERLPSRREVSEPWPMQRDWLELKPGKDDLARQHSGGDWLFVAWLLQGGIDERTI